MTVQSLTSIHPCQICVPLIGPTSAELSQQWIKAFQQADLIELRVDRFERIDLDQIQCLRQKFPMPLMVTIRKQSHGGHFKGSEQERLKLFQTCLNLDPLPDYIDIEADTDLDIIRRMQKQAPSVKWVISWHDFSHTPNELEACLAKLYQIPASYYKIATKAHSTCDALRLLCLAKQANANASVLCAIGMGEEGQCTRILSPVVGSPFTFAALETGLESAPGQIPLDTLLNTYQFRDLNRQTEILGLIGDPVDKSMSQLTHNAVLRELGLNGVYVKFKVRKEELALFIQHAQSLGIKGLSVTMPHKETILTCLNPSDFVLHLIGACNTLLFDQEKIKGCNTDGEGALQALGVHDWAHKKMVILGAGGTAKAIAYEAKKRGVSLTILNRTSSHAQALAAQLGCRWGNLKDLATQEYDLLVQATSVGMAPDLDAMPVEIAHIQPGKCVLEVISNPSETQLLKWARAKGCEGQGGLELFIHQAVAQFVFWFGEKVNQKIIEKTIRQKLSIAESSKKGITVKKSQLSGSLALPPSKSHSIRAVLLGAMAQGKSIIYHPLQSPDVKQAIKAVRQLGAIVQEKENGLEILGVGGEPQAPDDVIDAGNSGQILRFVGALAALGSHYTIITGDQSIRSNRVVQPLLDGLKGLGVFAESSRQNGFAPIIIKGPLHAGKTVLDGEDSQPVSGILMAAAFTEGVTEIRVRHPGEKPWIALTLSWLDRLGIKYTNDNFQKLSVQGRKHLPGFELTIPGDFSSAAFPIVAALITQSDLIIHHVDMNDVQGDKAIIYLLQEMGANIEIDHDKRCLHVKKGAKLKGKEIDINMMIDAITILAVLGCFAEGETFIKNGAIARYKECDRITCIVSELRKMGADITEHDDGFSVRPAPLKGTSVKSYDDHRMALSLIVAGLAADGVTHIEDIECMAKSYPTFIADMRQLGAFILQSD